MQRVLIGGREVGAGAPCYVIAEVGYNHLGNLETGRELVRQAKRANADAVKFQTFRADGLALKRTEHFRLCKEAEFWRTEFADLARCAADAGIAFLSTPFDAACVDLLDELGVPAFKVASMDLDNLPLLHYIAGKRKPMIVSTGMGTLGEIETALAAIRAAGNDQVVLLHCVSDYPLREEDANLRLIQTLAGLFDVPVGYSDHTTGIVVPLAATVLGACALEKHFTLDRSVPGGDNSISAEPDELADLVAHIRIVERALGSGQKILGPSEQEGRRRFRRGLYARVPIPRGTRIEADMLKSVRPAAGLTPVELPLVLGRQARTDIPEEAPITWEVV